MHTYYPEFNGNIHFCEKGKINAIDTFDKKVYQVKGFQILLIHGDGSGESKFLQRLSQASPDRYHSQLLDYIERPHHLRIISDWPTVESLYQNILKNDLEDEILELVRGFDNRIANIKIIDDSMMVKVDGVNTYTHIYNHSQQVQKVLLLILLIYNNKGGELFVDDLFSDISYTKINYFWTTLMKLSVVKKCKLFMVVNNLEHLRQIWIELSELNDIDRLEMVNSITTSIDDNGFLRLKTRDQKEFMKDIDYNEEVREI